MMSLKTKARWISQVLVLGLVAACATPNDPAKISSSEPDQKKSAAESEQDFRKRMSELVDNDPLFAAMAAELSAQSGDLNSATVAYTEAAKHLQDPELAKRAVELNLSSSNAELALQAAQVWESLAPQDKQASRTVLLLQLSTNRVKQALPGVKKYIATLEKQEDNHPGVQAASPLKATLDLLMRIPDKALAYQTGLDLIGDEAEITEEQYVLSQLADAADRPSRAIEHLKRVIQKVPEERYHVLMAQFMEKRDGNTNAAVVFLGSQTEKHPDWFSARLYLARIHTQQNQWLEASGYFKQLIRLQPTNYALYSSQGFVLTKLGRAADAERHFKIYLDNTPPAERQNELLIYMSLADLYAGQKDYQQAITWLNQAPNADLNLDVQLRMHQLYKEQNKMSQAAQILERFEPQNEEDTVRLTLALSQFVEEMKQPDKAVSLLNKALADYPDQEDLLYERAMVAERQSDLNSVEYYLRRLIEVRPQNPHGYNALGYTFAENGIRLDEALELIKKANALAPRDPYILDSLGWVYFKLGQLQLAESALLEAYNIQQDEEIGRHLVELYISQGRKTDAQNMLIQLKTRYPESPELDTWAQKADEIELR